MISVLDYTRKLLYEHDCVVLPDLGGFIAYFSHAFYSTQNALYHPPQKRVAFNEAIKLDDGLLVHYLMVNEQITREEAQKHVRQYVEEVKSSFRQSQPFELSGIGTLFTNEEGKIQFEPDAKTNFYQDGFGLASVAVNSVEILPRIEEADSTADWTLTDRSAADWELVTPRRRSRKGVYLGAALLLGIGVVAGFTQLPSSTLTSNLNPFAIVETVQGWLSVDKKDNTVSNKVEVIDTEPPIPTPAKVSVENTPPALETLPVTPVVKEEEKEEVTEVSKKAIAETKKSFSSDENQTYLVMAGGFSQLSNAEKLVGKLQRNRYPDAHILNPSPEEGKLILVAAVGYDSPREAKMHLKRVGHLSGAKAWVKKY